MGHSQSKPETVKEIQYVYIDVGPGPAQPQPHVSSQDVEDNLESSLRTAARDLLANDFGLALSNGAALESYLEGIAKAGFKNEFKYDWSLENCSPPNKLAIVKPTTDFCIFNKHDDLTASIKSYVDDGLSSAHLESWIKAKATADFTTTIGNCTKNACDNKWYCKPWKEAYNASDSTMDSYECNMMIVYTNAARTESAVDVTLNIFYFVGVYYTVKSPTKEAFGGLQSNAYAAAQKLNDGYRPTVNNDVALTTALQQYSIPNFKSKWGYNYETDKPSDFPKNESNSIYTKTTHLCYFQSKSTFFNNLFLDNYIQQNIMGGLNIPIDTARASIQNDIKAIFQEIISDSNSGQWNIESIDKKYELHKTSENPLRMNALVVQWYDSKSLEVDDTDGKAKNVTVEMIYMYFLGVVYELTPNQIEQDLMQELIKNIPGIKQSLLPSKITPDLITSSVETYNCSKFKDEYGIDFPTKASSHTEKRWRVFLEFPSWMPSDDAIQKSVTKNLFGPDDTKDQEIKHGKQADVYNFIVDSIKYYSGTDYPKSNNQWYSRTKKDSLPYKVKDVDWILDVRTSWAFANGKMTEDGDGGETAQRFYVSLLLHITVEKDDEEGEDV